MKNIIITIYLLAFVIGLSGCVATQNTSSSSGITQVSYNPGPLPSIPPAPSPTPPPVAAIPFSGQLVFSDSTGGLSMDVDSRLSLTDSNGVTTKLGAAVTLTSDNDTTFCSNPEPGTDSRVYSVSLATDDPSIGVLGRMFNLYYVNGTCSGMSMSCVLVYDPVQSTGYFYALDAEGFGCDNLLSQV